MNWASKLRCFDRCYATNGTRDMKEVITCDSSCPNVLVPLTSSISCLRHTIYIYDLYHIKFQTGEKMRHYVPMLLLSSNTSLIIFKLFVLCTHGYTLDYRQNIMTAATMYNMVVEYHSAKQLFVSVHYSDVIMSGMASHITSIMIVHSTVCSGADQRKNIKAPRLWHLCGEFTGHRWIPGTKVQ